MKNEVYKVIVAGGRDFNDYELLVKTLDKFRVYVPYFEVVSGKARGADSLGERYAKEHKLPIQPFPPNWNLGKVAAILRNEEMGNYADALIAFWDSSSPGTKHMINYATKKGLQVIVVKY